LEKALDFNIDGPAKGSIMEVKEEKGLGKTIDVIIYDGTLRVNDTIVIGGIDAPIVTKVRALFEPMPLVEMREKKAKFNSVKQVVAATGVKISAPEIDKVIAGMPLLSAKTPEDIEAAKDLVQKEVQEVLIETGMEGIVIKADNIGSLEAMIKILKEKNVMIRNASIGHITKKDIADAESNFEKNPTNSVILGFNSKLPEDLIVPKKVKIILNDVIYRLVEDYEKWRLDAENNIEALKLEMLTKPCKIQILAGYVFRQNNPAVVGVEVLGGKLFTGMSLMNAEGKEITEVNGIQLDKKSISEVEKGKRVAISLPKVTVGRQINENDFLYSAIPEEDFRKMKELKKYLNFDEIQIIKEIAIIKRKENPVWGI
jgi:translation initiation factor 5B